MAATATTAGAAASLRPLLPALSALPSPTPLLRLPTNPKLTNLHLKTSILSSPLPITLLPLSSSSSSSSAAAFTETDDEKEENQFQPTKSTPRPSRPDDAGRLYVGNLPYSLTAPQLSEVFSAAGSVISVEIVYDRVTDRSRGFAFVTMASADEATEAIRMFDGSQVGGRTVKVNFPEVPRGGEREVMGPRPRGSWRSRGYVDSPYKVYAGNLGWGVTSEALRDAFAGSAGVLGAKVIYELGTGRSRGYGFLSFASPEQARAAIEDMNGKELEGRPLRLNLASERPSVAAAAAAAAAGASAEEASDSPSGLFQESLT